MGKLGQLTAKSARGSLGGLWGHSWLSTASPGHWITHTKRFSLDEDEFFGVRQRSR